jgi:hypothetical protein
MGNVMAPVKKKSPASGVRRGRINGMKRFLWRLSYQPAANKNLTVAVKAW